MFDSTRKSTGTNYTTTVALIVAALFFSPGMLLVSGHPSYGWIFAAAAFSLLCLCLAWVTWNRSQLTIESIQPARPRGK